MSKITISAVVSTFNREDLLERVLQSLSWVDELIVIDNGSSDKTVEIAKTYTNFVFVQKNKLMLNINKNIGIVKAKGDWILYLDDDEEIPEDLAKEIQVKITELNDINGYWISRKNIIFGKWIQHGIWWPDKQLRLFRKGKGRYPEKHIHEYIVVDGNISSLHNSYIHYNYNTVNQFLRKLNTLYTENEVNVMLQKGQQLSWVDVIRFPASDFIKIYFAQAGYKDGLHGLVLAIFQAIYAFVVFVKLWEKQGFPQKDISYFEVDKEIEVLGKEIRFWRLSTQINLSNNPLTIFILKVLRKFQKIW